MKAENLDTLYRDVELPLSHVLADMEQVGILVDAGFLKDLSQTTAREIQDLETTIHEMSGAVFNIGSPKQLQKVLFETLQLPVVRKTKTGASTDADVLEQLATQHPVPAKILEYRSLTKLKGTYLDALPLAVHPDAPFCARDVGQGNALQSQQSLRSRLLSVGTASDRTPGKRHR